MKLRNRKRIRSKKKRRRSRSYTQSIPKSASRTSIFPSKRVSSYVSLVKLDPARQVSSTLYSEKWHSSLTSRSRHLEA